MGDTAKRDANAEQAASQGAAQVVEENTKTKSVLQGKLSNLAIQIGYIGKLSLVKAYCSMLILSRLNRGGRYCHYPYRTPLHNSVCR